MAKPFDLPPAASPSWAAPIDRRNPINRGLAMLTNFGASGQDAKSGAIGTVESGALIVWSPYGAALRPGSGPGGYKPANVTDASSFLSTTAYTLMLLVRVKSLGTRRIICADSSSAGITESINIEQNASNRWVTYHVNASAQWIGLTANLAVTTGWHWVEIVFKQGTGFYGLVDNVANATDISGAASIARRAGTDYRLGRPGAFAGLPFDGDIAFHGAWNRALSDQERATVRSNPGALFAPQRRIFAAGFPAAGGNVSLTPGAAALTLAGFSPTLAQTTNSALTPGVLGLSLAAFAPTVMQGSASTLVPGALALTISTFSPTLAQTTNASLTPGQSALTLSTFAPTVSAGAGITLTPGVLALTLAGFAPTVAQTKNVGFSPAPSALAVQTFAPTLAQTGSKAFTPAAAALVLQIFAPTVARSGAQVQASIPTSRLVRAGSSMSRPAQSSSRSRPTQ